MTDHEVIEACYQALNDRDADRLCGLLASDDTHTGPHGCVAGRSEAVTLMMAATGAVSAADVEIFGDGPCVMLRYRLVVETRPEKPEGALSDCVRVDGGASPRWRPISAAARSLGSTRRPNLTRDGRGRLAFCCIAAHIPRSRH